MPVEARLKTNKMKINTEGKNASKPKASIKVKSAHVMVIPIKP
jgi:hypothetical protein